MNDFPDRAAALLCAGCISFAGWDFQPANVGIGVFAAFLVRVPLFKPKARLAAEISFMLLGMLGTFATVVEYRTGSGPSFWIGIVYGAAASSLLEIGKTMARSALKERVQAAIRILFGVKAP